MSSVAALDTLLTLAFALPGTKGHDRPCYKIFAVPALDGMDFRNARNFGFLARLSCATLLPQDVGTFSRGCHIYGDYPVDFQAPLTTLT